MRVGFDNNILVYASREDLPAVDATGRDIAALQRRARALVATIGRERSEVVVPTVVLSEFLCGIAREKRDRFLAELSPRFFAQPFDDRAAAVAAELFLWTRSQAAEPWSNKRLLKINTMIVASCQVAGCAILYIHDVDCRKLAERLGMAAADLPDDPGVWPHDRPGRGIELG